MVTREAFSTKTCRPCWLFFLSPLLDYPHLVSSVLSMWILLLIYFLSVSALSPTPLNSIPSLALRLSPSAAGPLSHTNPLVYMWDAIKSKPSRRVPERATRVQACESDFNFDARPRFLPAPFFSFFPSFLSVQPAFFLDTLVFDCLPRRRIITSNQQLMELFPLLFCGRLLGEDV